MADDRPHPVRKRIETVLRGRSMRQWQVLVHLSAGTASRLLAGEFPDPERLLPAIRIERLSLTWLLDGIGTPYSVHAPATDRDAARLLEQLVVDEPKARVLIVHSASGFTVVVHRHAETEHPKLGAYHYLSADVIGGASLRIETARMVLSHGGEVSEVEFQEEDRLRLAAGHMGNTELFGDPPNIGFFRSPLGGLAGAARRVDRQVKEAREPGMVELLTGRAVTYLVDQEREVMRIFRGLDPREQSTVLRMLRGLRPSG